MFIFTIFMEDDFFSAQCLRHLSISDVCLVHVASDEVVYHYVFREFWNGEWVEAPVDGVPPLECVVCWNKHRILFIWKKYSFTIHITKKKK